MVIVDDNLHFRRDGRFSPTVIDHDLAGINLIPRGLPAGVTADFLK